MNDTGQVFLLADNEDRVVFTLAAEDTVINDTVKIIATISVVLTRDNTEATLRTAIRDMLNNFIGASWQISNLTRDTHSSGLEALSLTATARVPETENYALDKRRLEASHGTEGLTISRVSTDLSFPASLVEKTERHLRTEIVRKARTECDLISAAMNRPMRIKQITYGIDGDHFSTANRPSISMASMKTGYGSGFSADATASGSADIMGNAQKLTIGATITLAMEDTAD